MGEACLKGTGNKVRRNQSAWYVCGCNWKISFLQCVQLAMNGVLLKGLSMWLTGRVLAWHT